MITDNLSSESSVDASKCTDPPSWFPRDIEPYLAGHLIVCHDRKEIMFGVGDSECPKGATCLGCSEDTDCQNRPSRHTVTVSLADAKESAKSDSIWQVKWDGPRFDPNRCPTSVKLTNEQLMGAFGIIDHVEGETNYFRDRMGAQSGHLQHYSRAGNFLAFPGPNFSEATQYWLFLKLDPQIKEEVLQLCELFAQTA